MDQQQARDRAVLAQLVEDRRARLSGFGDRLHDPPQAIAVHRDHGGDKLLCERPCSHVGELVDPGRQILDPLE